MRPFLQERAQPKEIYSGYMTSVPRMVICGVRLVSSWREAHMAPLTSLFVMRQTVNSAAYPFSRRPMRPRSPNLSAGTEITAWIARCSGMPIVRNFDNTWGRSHMVSDL